MDEIDAIGGKRFSEGTSSDREIQRTLMEVLTEFPVARFFAWHRLCGIFFVCVAEVVVGNITGNNTGAPVLARVFLPDW